ncbi:MAG: hypothetical protein WBO15_04650 [Gammaproteobacteria bacterium]
MKNGIAILALACASCLPLAAMGQQEEEQSSFVYATYMNCDTTRQEEADAIVATIQKPIMEAAVANGTITGWGWLAHHTGGKWRRIRYHSANSMPELLAALETIGAQVDEALGDDTSFGSICNQHDDYIWRSVTGSSGDAIGEDRGKAGLSVYYQCDIALEDRADEIVETIFAPIYNAHVGKGMLNSWGWSEHIVGGKYRRLATMTADDWPTLLKMRAAIFEDMDEQDNPLADYFGEICGSHSDYMWDIQFEG